MAAAILLAVKWNKKTEIKGYDIVGMKNGGDDATQDYMGHRSP